MQRDELASLWTNGDPKINENFSNYTKAERHFKANLILQIDATIHSSLGLILTGTSMMIKGTVIDVTSIDINGNNHDD